MRMITIVHLPAVALHTFALLAVAAACMIAGFFLVRRAFSPLDTMRARLADVRRGAAGELRGEYPSEVQPLVDDLNAMLAHDQRAVARGIGKAADLAHGLKTPLAVLAAEAERLAADGRSESADVVAEQVSRMRRQIEYQLAQARAAASGSPLRSRTPVSGVVDGLVRALRRLNASRPVAIDAEVDPRDAFRGRAEDLEEMLGNLMENACRWAAARVHVSVAAAGGRLAIAVDDDGPGLAPELRESVLRRGVRADEGAPGSGLGLAIARELAELYGGSIALESSPAGGLRARLDLPAADGS
jgi:signal transduction histidine kinase